jgi:branched-chain amino acid transport system permease protein
MSKTNENLDAGVAIIPQATESFASQHQVSQSSTLSRVAAVVGLCVLVVLILAPWWAGRGDMRLLGEIFLYLSLASLWNMLAGYSGLVSVGQQAFVGFGGYILFAMAMFSGVHPFMALPIVFLLGGLIAVPIAFLIFRLKGAYFAIGTWVIAEVFRLGFAQVSALGGGSGTSLPIAVVKSIAANRSARESYSYWLALGVLLIILASVYFFLRNRNGLALTAIRDNELAASSLGINILRTKIGVYVVTAAMTATVGALIFLQKLRISPDAAFSVNDWTTFVIFIVVIGGIGTLEGPIIGTLIYFALREVLADLGTTYLLIMGFVAIFVMLFAPKGIWGWVYEKYDIELFPVKRRVVSKK